MARRTATFLRKLLILLIGLPVVALGLVLIPLPGPGLLVTLLGLFILSLEFDWARKHVDNVKGQLMKATEKARRQMEEARKK